MTTFKNLLQNHWANFNQTWHKASLGDRDSSLFKFSQREDNNQIAKKKHLRGFDAVL